MGQLRPGRGRRAWAAGREVRRGSRRASGTRQRSRTTCSARARRRGGRRGVEGGGRRGGAGVGLKGGFRFSGGGSGGKSAHRGGSPVPRARLSRPQGRPRSAAASPSRRRPGRVDLGADRARVSRYREATRRRLAGAPPFPGPHPTQTAFIPRNPWRARVGPNFPPPPPPARPPRSNPPAADQTGGGGPACPAPRPPADPACLPSKPIRRSGLSESAPLLAAPPVIPGPDRRRGRGPSLDPPCTPPPPPPTPTPVPPIPSPPRRLSPNGSIPTQRKPKPLLPGLEYRASARQVGRRSAALRSPLAASLQAVGRRGGCPGPPSIPPRTLSIPPRNLSIPSRRFTATTARWSNTATPVPGGAVRLVSRRGGCPGPGAR